MVWSPKRFWFQIQGNNYAFGYQVHEPISGSFYQQEESSNGDKTVRYKLAIHYRWNNENNFGAFFDIMVIVRKLCLCSKYVLEFAVSASVLGEKDKSQPWQPWKKMPCGIGFFWYPGLLNTARIGPEQENPWLLTSEITFSICDTFQMSNSIIDYKGASKCSIGKSI